MQLVELSLGKPASGGGFVARDDTGRVIFVRHGLPGERVMARITEEHSTWARADAVEILEASPDRVKPPCSYAGPDGCGGCDYQHVSLNRQRKIKQELLEAQLSHVAGLDFSVEIEAADSGSGLGRRTRVRFVADEDGRLGFRRHSSHDVVAVDKCLVAVDRITALKLNDLSWPEGTEVEAVALNESSSPSLVITSDDAASKEPDLDTLRLTKLQKTIARDERYTVSPEAFWQIHERAPEILAGLVLKGLNLKKASRVIDLYCGAGLFTKAISSQLGPNGRVTGIEFSKVACKSARANLAGRDGVEIITSRVNQRAVNEHAVTCTHAVIDPPRSGIDKRALVALAAIPTLERIVSVSCDAGTFARDLKLFMEHGWKVIDLRAFDLFEMTEHAEYIAVLVRS